MLRHFLLARLLWLAGLATLAGLAVLAALTLSAYGTSLFQSPLMHQSFHTSALIPNQTISQKQIEATIAQIQEQARLATVESIGPVTILFRDSKTMQVFNQSFDIPGTARSFSAFGLAKAVAGLNTEKIQVKEVSGQKITLHLPPPTLFYQFILPESWSIQNDAGLLRKMTADEVHRLEAEALQEFTRIALEDGILEKAESKAKDVITQLLANSGFREVVFVN